MATRVRREHEIAQFDSGHPDVWPGVVTEACRSDTAAAVVRLHLGPLIRNREEIQEFKMYTQRIKRQALEFASGVVV